MTKAIKPTLLNIQTETFAFIRAQLAANKRVTFDEIRARIYSVFGADVKFNWLRGVRSPMQALMNDGTMVRDPDIFGPEAYNAR